MSGIDGFEATHHIRRVEAAQPSVRGASAARHTPIIALTPNALCGDRERYLAVGMDDYLGKPLRRVQLRDVMTAR